MKRGSSAPSVRIVRIYGLNGNMYADILLHNRSEHLAGGQLSQSVMTRSQCDRFGPYSLSGYIEREVSICGMD
jgi:hypothetical protein